MALIDDIVTETERVRVYAQTKQRQLQTARTKLMEIGALVEVETGDGLAGFGPFESDFDFWYRVDGVRRRLSGLGLIDIARLGKRADEIFQSIKSDLQAETTP